MATTTRRQSRPRCHLLALPFETRQEILSYLVPQSFVHDREFRPITCTRGNVAFLRVCKQLYDEGIALLYSTSVFEFDVGSHGMHHFRNMPNGWRRIPDYMAYLPSMKKIRVSVLYQLSKPTYCSRNLALLF